MELQGQWAELLPRAKQALIDVVDSGRYILGPQVKAFEEEAAAALGVAHGIGVANGTDALALALRAVGVGPGDEVICPSYTFYATAEAIAAIGAVPVFADIGADYNLDPAAAEAAVTPGPVRWCSCTCSASRPTSRRSGRCATGMASRSWRMRPRRSEPRASPRSATSRRFLLPDARTCRRSATAGLITTPRDDVADTCRTLRFHGSRDKQTFTQIGYNSRLDELHAAVLRVFLEACRAGTPRGRQPRRGPRSRSRRARHAAARRRRLPPLHGPRRRARPRRRCLQGGRHRLRRLLRSGRCTGSRCSPTCPSATCR